MDDETYPWVCTSPDCNCALGHVYTRNDEVHLILGALRRVAVNRTGLLSVQCPCGWWSMWTRGAPYETPQLQAVR